MESEHGVIFGPKKDIIYDDLSTDFGPQIWVPGAEEGVILSLHDEHHGSVSGWGIHGAKGHDGVAMLQTIRANKGELFLILLMDSNLMEASFAVKTNEVQSAMGVAKVVKGVIAAGNGVFE